MERIDVENNLLNCPFCDGKANIGMDWDEWGKSYIEAYCERCGATISIVLKNNDDSTIDESIEELEGMWNSRV